MKRCPRCGFDTPEGRRREVPGPYDWECTECAWDPIVGLNTGGHPFLRIGDAIRSLDAANIERLLMELQCARELL